MAGSPSLSFSPQPIGRRIATAFAVCAGLFTLALATALWRVPAHGPFDGLTLALAAAALGLGCWIAAGLVRALREEQASGAAMLARLAAGDCEADLKGSATLGAGELAEPLTRLASSLRARAQAASLEAAIQARLRIALDKSAANILVADNDGLIVYANDRMQSLLRSKAGDIRRARPGFDADRILGTSFDALHEWAARERESLAAQGAPRVLEARLGDLLVKMLVSALTGENGERLGTVSQWIDRTAEASTEAEIQIAVDAAARGDLSRRIRSEGKQGFFQTLSVQLNALLATNERVFADLQRALEALARGSLTERMSGDYQGTYEALKTHLNATTDKLVDVVERIQLAADLVTAGAREIAAGNQNLTNRTEQQAASLQQTSASMEEMTSAVKHTADSAAQANQLSTAARDLADKGGAVVGRAVASMHAINESSRRISEIIGAIEEIAFQTNLLALNAAVEAARAGEHGRGFAVVASEVRNLAVRSAQAARETKSLIEESVRNVTDGSRLVDESGRTLDEIVTSVKRATDLVGEISASSREQASGVDDVSQAIVAMDAMTQQNAALVQGSAASARALTEQAEALSELVAFFDLGPATRRRVAPAVVADGAGRRALGR